MKRCPSLQVLCPGTMCSPCWMLSSYTFMCITSVVLLRSTVTSVPSFLLQVPILSEAWSAHHSLLPGRRRQEYAAAFPIRSRPSSKERWLHTDLQAMAWKKRSELSLWWRSIPSTAARGGNEQSCVWTGPGERERASRNATITLPALTHDGQGRRLAQLTLHGLDHLQVAAVQVASVDGAIARADPVQLALWVVNGQAWKAMDYQCPGGTQGPSPSGRWDGTGRVDGVMEKTGTRRQGDPAQTSCQPSGEPGLPEWRLEAFRASKDTTRQGGTRGTGGIHTNRPFLVGEEKSAVAAVHVGHADVVSVCPVQLPAPVRGH